jgi:hypothetical protein
MWLETFPVLCIGLCAVSQTTPAQLTTPTYDTNGEYVETFVGSGVAGYVNGQGQQTDFSSPTQVVADTASNLFVWDSGNHLIRKLTPGGTVSTFVGGGADIEGDGTNVSLSIYSVGAIAMDKSNTLWLLAAYGQVQSLVYLLNVSTNGYVSIENGGAGFSNLTANSGLCFDSSNNLYYSGGNIIYRFNPSTNGLQVFAGSGVAGYLDGNGIFTDFNYPTALACDEANNIYVWDADNFRVRKIDQNQNVTTITGYPFFGETPESTDGTGTNALIPGISTMFSDNAGNVYFTCGTCIRMMNAQTNVVTLAGSFTVSGFANGAGNVARFFGALGGCFSQGMVFVADSSNQRIRRISFNVVAQPVTGPNLSIGTYAGIQITGLVGRTYQIQSSTDITTWNTVATLLLTSSPYLWFDTSTFGGNKFYRAFLLP